MQSDFRHSLRRFIPRGVYQCLSNAANALAVLRKEGWSAYLSLRARHGREKTLRLKSLRHPFTIRCSESHAGAIIQNVLRGEYDAWTPDDEPRVIIDAGGFIGDLACHWATLYPQARIVCLEPNPDNHVYASRNLAPYAPNVTLLNKGLWSKPGTLSVAGDEMGSHLVADNGRNASRVEVIDVPSLMRELGLSQIDVLKLDIEGAEKEVLNADSSSWLPLVKQAIVEMHGKDIEEAIVPHMNREGFDARRYRSLIFFSRRQPSAPTPCA